MQPDDAGEAAEHFALAALLEHRRAGAAVERDEGGNGVHCAPSQVPKAAAGVAAACRRAARSFSTNWAALMT